VRKRASGYRSSFSTTPPSAASQGVSLKDLEKTGTVCRLHRHQCRESHDRGSRTSKDAAAAPTQAQQLISTAARAESGSSPDFIGTHTEVSIGGTSAAASRGRGASTSPGLGTAGGALSLERLPPRPHVSASQLSQSGILSAPIFLISSTKALSLAGGGTRMRTNSAEALAFISMRPALFPFRADRQSSVMSQSIVA
jgi:hypothetical protein